MMRQNIHIREANPSDIDEMHDIRMSVKENVLRNQALVTKADYERFLGADGKGWIATTNESNGVGFAIIDIQKHSVWALFVRPEFEKRGIGRGLQERMLSWFFAQHREASTLWLTTAPHTRAENFYRNSGWRSTGTLKNGEIRFERFGP